ncbi:uncharacterized protein BBOV_IV004280 [Babesia bovis T2Bo]|uniref:Poly(A) RNA polymerase mitochondrial-like central palm domain-containing protein n=1 Tax=Babesia bovis TaxID=5865 RepID=A7AQH0_BABBO|nr:uncharacterized protein BBOV_IV004280 [Babesia bovis T2Bo]EDO06789.1 hypothetical protein BBOV_IV004280 [Babesia bovis T2Bo]|eukprot:XP_001610357.1 hypothetical protein [Babesia bovis T2Bo]
MGSAEHCTVSALLPAHSGRSLSDIDSELFCLNGAKNLHADSSMSTCTSVINSSVRDVDELYAMPSPDDCYNCNYGREEDISGFPTVWTKHRDYRNGRTRKRKNKVGSVRRSHSIEDINNFRTQSFTRKANLGTSTGDVPLSHFTLKRPINFECPLQHKGTDYSDITQPDDVEFVVNEQSPTCYDGSSDDSYYKCGGCNDCFRGHIYANSNQCSTTDSTDSSSRVTDKSKTKYVDSQYQWNRERATYVIDHNISQSPSELPGSSLSLNSWGSADLCDTATTRYDEEFPSLPGQQSIKYTKDGSDKTAVNEWIIRQGASHKAESVRDIGELDLPIYVKNEATLASRQDIIQDNTQIEMYNDGSITEAFVKQLIFNKRLPKNGTTHEYKHSANVDMDSVLETVTAALLTTEYKLNRLVDRITPSMTCKSNKTQIFNVLKRFLKYNLGDDIEVFLTGSTAYDIDIDYSNLLGIQAYSDMDIEVIAPRYGCSARTILRNVYNGLCEMQVVLKRANMLSNCPFASSSFKLVDTARVPIVIMQSRNGIQCDISANASNAIKHNDCFGKYIERHPMLRKLMRLAKHWLKFRGIPTMKEGGFPTIFWMMLFCDIVDTCSTIKAEHQDVSQNILDSHRVMMDDNGSGPGDFTILGALEQSFKILAKRNYLIDIVNLATSGLRNRYGYRLERQSQWHMGDIGMNLISLIEMEPSVPFATWVVYYFEIKRAADCLTRYRQHLKMLLSIVVCLRAHVILQENKQMDVMDDIRVLIKNVEERFGHNMQHLLSVNTPIEQNIEQTVQRVANALSIKFDCKHMAKFLKMLSNYIIQKMATSSMSIFREAYDKVYSIPASIEPPTPLIMQHDRGGFYSGPPIPRFHGAMWRDNGWFMVAIDGALHIVKALKTCVCWDSWWSTKFINRRDTKSIIHGFIFKRIDLYVDDLDDVEEVEIPEPQLPNLLVRVSGVVLFRPCDIVSRLYVMKVTKEEINISPYCYSNDIFTGAKTLYVLPGYEVARFDQMDDVTRDLVQQCGMLSSARANLPRHCSHCGTIRLNIPSVPKDIKFSPRQIKNLRTLLCSAQYREYYRCLKASLRRIERNVRQQTI